jgi:hypothetical protein
MGRAGCGGCQVHFRLREGQVEWMCICARGHGQGGGGGCEHVEGWCEVLCVRDEEAGGWDREVRKDCDRGGQKEVQRARGGAIRILRTSLRTRWRKEWRVMFLINVLDESFS